MKTTTYKLKEPLFGWAKGEHFDFHPEWNEWVRKKTGETLDLRGSIAEGEKVMVLNYLSMETPSILEKLL